MIVSHKHKFIFIKTKKTASSSTECALSAVCGPDDILTDLKHTEQHRLGELSAQNYSYMPPLFSREWPNLISRFLRHGKAPFNYYDHMNAWRVEKRLSKTVWNSYFKFAFDRNPWDREMSWYSHRFSQGRTLTSFAEHVLFVRDSLRIPGSQRTRAASWRSHGSGKLEIEHQLPGNKNLAWLLWNYENSLLIQTSDSDDNDHRCWLC